MRRAGGRVRNTVLLIVFILLLTLTVVLTVSLEPLQEMQRAAAIREVLALLDGGTTAVDIATDTYPLHGEEDAAPSLAADAALLGGDAAVAQDAITDGRVALRLYGAIAVPALDLRLPLYLGAGATALRFGAGVVTTPDATVILGYRTRVGGRLFHNIDRLSVGDGVTLTRVDRVRTAYTVAAIRLVRPDALAAEIAAPPDGASVAVVSNHPAGETGYRIVIWLLQI